MLPGNDKGKDMSLSTMFEAVGAKKAGLIDQEELTYIEQMHVRDAVHVRHVYSKFHELFV